VDRDATTCKQMLPVGRPNWAPDKCSLGANQITRRLRLSAHNSRTSPPGVNREPHGASRG
ncbi:MAG: hypothetical protein WCP62_09945, partial [Planctomycetota bacterium]